MATGEATEVGSRLREARERAGLTQAQLADRADVSRQLVGAAEAGRHLPRVDAALALAAALGESPEALFGPRQQPTSLTGRRLRDGTPVRVAQVGALEVFVPVRPDAGEGWVAADAVVAGGRLEHHPRSAPATFVVCGCDPALGLAEALVARKGSGRLLAASTSTAVALDALAAGRTHAACVHGPEGGLPEPGDAPDVRRVHLARWRVGLAAVRDLGPRAWREALTGHREVVQRETGAQAQQAFVRAARRAGGRTPDGPVARGHLDAARLAAASGRVAVTIEPAALALGLAFRPLEVHAAELWFAAASIEHPGAEVFGNLLVSSELHDRLRALGGYDLEGAGGVVSRR